MTCRLGIPTKQTVQVRKSANSLSNGMCLLSESSYKLHRIPRCNFSRRTTHNHTPSAVPLTYSKNIDLASTPNPRHNSTRIVLTTSTDNSRPCTFLSTVKYRENKNIRKIGKHHQLYQASLSNSGMEKYVGLPDIEHDSRDVFESSDIEEDLEKVVGKTPRDTVVAANADEDTSSEIHTGTFLSAESARSRFANDVVIGNVDIVDFSGSVVNPVLGTRGYSVQQVEENTEQKLARIARELEEIRLAQQKEPSGDPIHDKTLELVDLLAGFEDSAESHFDLYTNKLDELFKQPYLQYPSTPESVKFTDDLVNTSQVFELESRIDSLESLLGTDPIDLHTGANISSKLNDLKRRINIINNPEFPIDKIKQEIVQLNKETEKAVSNRRLYEVQETTQSVESSVDTKVFDETAVISDLYGHLPAFETTNTIVPSIIKRLKSLNTVHSDMANCVNVVNSLDEVLKEMDHDILKWDESIAGLNSNISEYEKNFELNKKVMDEKIDELAKRVEKMSSD